MSRIFKGVLVAVFVVAFSRAFAEDLVSKEACKKDACTGGDAQSVEGAEAACEHCKLNTNDPFPVCPKHIEVNFRYVYATATREWDNERNLEKRKWEYSSVPSTLITVGAIPDLDFNLATSYTSQRDDEFDYNPADAVAGPHAGAAWGDTTLGLRYRFINDEKRGLAAAFTSNVTAPTGLRSSARHLASSQEYWSWDNALVAAKDWGRWTTNAELGFTLPFGGRQREFRGALRANLACGYQVLKWLQPEVELNFQNDFVRRGSGADVLAVTAGLVLPLSERICIQAGAQRAILGRNNDRTTAGILNIKLAW